MTHAAIKTLADYEREKEMVDRWMPLLVAAGYRDMLRDLTPFDTHALAGHIMKDKIVQAILWRDDTYKRFDAPGFGSFDADYEGILKALGEDGRAALRARIRYQPSYVIKHQPRLD